MTIHHPLCLCQDCGMAYANKLIQKPIIQANDKKAEDLEIDITTSKTISMERFYEDASTNWTNYYTGIIYGINRSLPDWATERVKKATRAETIKNIMEWIKQANREITLYSYDLLFGRKRIQEELNIIKSLKILQIDIDYEDMIKIKMNDDEFVIRIMNVWEQECKEHNITKEDIEKYMALI